MQNQTVRKSKRLKEKHTKKISKDQKNEALPVHRSKRGKSNVINNDSDFEISKPKRKFIGTRNKTTDKTVEITNTSTYNANKQTIDYSDGENTNDSGSDLEQNLFHKNKRSRKKSILNNIQSDSSSEENEENHNTENSSPTTTTDFSLENTNTNSTKSIDKNENTGSDTDCSLPKLRTFNKLKRLKGSSSEEEEKKAEDNPFETPIKRKLDETPSSLAVKRSARLKSKSESTFSLPSRSHILDDIEGTPVKGKDVRYYRQKRGIQQNNLVKWFVYYPIYILNGYSNREDLIICVK